MRDLESHSDEELIRLSREGGGEVCLDVLYRRYYRKVAYWCLRISGDGDTAADLAQDVFLRVHDRLDSFRGDSRFSTWLYTLTRRVAINRLTSVERRRTEQADEGVIEERLDPGPDPGPQFLPDSRPILFCRLAGIRIRSRSARGETIMGHDG